VFNIQKAVSRLPFSPKLKDVEITDIKNGIGVFTPKAGQTVSFVALKESLKKAGYTLASAKLTVNGKLVRDADLLWIEDDTTRQRFLIEGDGLDASAPNGPVEVTGDWKTTGAGKEAREVILPIPAKKAEFKGTLIGLPGREVAVGEPLNGWGTARVDSDDKPGLY
jgi:hypothetical protein